MTNYVAGYDTESLRCINGVRAIVAQHKKYNAPATFFIVGELLEDKELAKEYKKLLSDPLFEVASHTYTHILIKKTQRCPSVDLDFVKEEIRKSKEIIEQVFEKEILGFRSPRGFYGGISGESELLRALWDCGYRYVSTKTMASKDVPPAELTEPSWYTEDILRPIAELPGHDWHDNILNGFTPHSIAWPAALPWGYPEKVPTTAKEEADIYSRGMDYAYDKGYSYYSPIFHPWSVYRFNSDAEHIGLLLSGAKQKGMKMMNYSMQFEQFKNENKI